MRGIDQKITGFILWESEGQFDVGVRWVERFTTLLINAARSVPPLGRWLLMRPTSKLLALGATSTAPLISGARFSIDLVLGDCWAAGSICYLNTSGHRVVPPRFWSVAALCDQVSLSQ